MQGHKFEDNVHKQMDDLSLRPSEGVWDRVELALRKDRKRRRLFFVLPLFLAVVLGSYWWIQRPGKPVVAVTDKNTINEIRTWTKKSNESGGDPAIVKQDERKEAKSKTQDNTQRVVSSSENYVEASPEKDQIGSKIDDQENGIKRNKKPKAIKQLSLDVSPESISRNIKKEDQSVIPANPAVNNSIDESGGGEIKSKEVDGVSDKQISLRNQQLGAPEKKTTQVGKKDSVVAIMRLPITDSINSIENTKDITKNVSSKMKWQWGISASAGIARVVQGGLINVFEKSLVMDAAAFNSPVQTPGSPGYTKPAFIKGGLNWSAGIFTQRKLAKRLELSAGLQYHYFSTSNSIGSRIDSTRIINNGTSNSLRVDGYYRSGTDGNYTSNYHFLELPLTLHAQLTKTKRTPFYWNSGLSVGQLLSTNALHYDGGSGYYYKDNSLFRRTQLALHTGLSVKLFNQNKHPLELGPQFHYKLSSLLRSNNNDQRHLMSGSLYLRWFLMK